ncbi:MAG: hypothetical protein ACR2NF_08345, partial [Pirellulales bacterium]
VPMFNVINMSCPFFGGGVFCFVTSGQYSRHPQLATIDLARNNFGGRRKLLAGNNLRQQKLFQTRVLPTGHFLTSFALLL